jgi:hypothetical protein
MTVEPYRSARRVFWISDNCSSHRAEKAAARLRSQRPQVRILPGAPSSNTKHTTYQTQSSARVLVTLRPEDTIEENGTEFIIDYSSTGERVRIFRGSLLWMSQRTHTITEVVK